MIHPHCCPERYIWSEDSELGYFRIWCYFAVEHQSYILFGTERRACALPETSLLHVGLSSDFHKVSV